jgi:transposase
METITMTAGDQERARVLWRLSSGELTVTEAAALLGLSERQVWRLRRAVAEAGPAGLVHGNRGRPSPRRTTPAIRDAILEVRARYGPLNDCHFRELLAEREGIELSRECLRTILRAAGLPSPRRRRPPAYRSRRPRLPAEGALLQLDGSRHDWLEGRGPWLTLVGAIDDATGLVVGGDFRDHEDSAGYLTVLRQVATRYGLPQAIYRDGHSAFEVTSPRRSGEPDLTQVGRALVELGIVSIAAGSAQAKGRIERLWGTFQDRLVVELRLAGITDRAGASAFLPGFIERHNARFSVPAVDPTPAWRPMPEELDLDRVFVFKYRRKVAKDHTVRVGARILQLPRRATGPANYAGKLIDVHEALDGTLIAWDGGRRLAVTAAPADPGQLRARHDPRALPGLLPAAAALPWVPPPDHPWKRVRSDSKLAQRLTDSFGR